MSKKRRVELPYPNNLFAIWIEEWRVEAKGKGWKSHYNYEKALKSLKKYPLPLMSGEEAKHTIQYCGDKLAKMLDQRLAAHEHTLGPHNETVNALGVGMDLGVDRVVGPTKRKKAGKSATDVELGCVDSPNKKAKKRVREYIPAYHSGPYAILLTLYRASKNTHYRGYMTKAELQSEAQTLCDASLTVPQPGTDYTAWSSMGNLTRKGLVCKYSSPAKYTLTENGIALAVKLETVDEEGRGGVANGRKTDASFQHHQPHKPTEQRQRPTHDSAVTCHVNVVSSDDEEMEMESLASRLSVHPPPAHDRLCAPPSHCTIAMPSDHHSSQAEKPMQRHDAGIHVVEEEGEEFVPLYTLRPGDFDIVLCIDYCEAAGAVTDRRMSVIQDLRKNGVACDLRKLQVGDFLWIAKERMAPVPGKLALPAGRELVLSHVVERKRVDDLAQSMKDGRFREQKFRLKESGLHHVIYLIEECYHRTPLCLPEKSLRQAVVNLQVMDGLEIKRTRNLGDTVAYLTVMTRTLTAMYKDKILVACPKAKLPHSVDFSLPTVKLLTFVEFCQSSVKNKVLTVREVFGKQLVQFDGVSAEIAIKILEEFPTLDSLLRAYDGLPSEEEKSKMLVDIRHGRTNRRLGDALSKTIYQFYCRH